ncbi:hypothetical protein [Mesorhizobium sp.]|nr:hypothetical protein [Mesorhizobium sp.]
MVKKPPAKKTVFRSSKDGQFVTEKYAEKRPATTEKERVVVKGPEKKSKS